MRPSVSAGLLALVLAVPVSGAIGAEGAASSVVEPVVAAPADIAPDPLRRAALVALPATYHVEVRFHVDALISGGRRIPIGRDVGFRGGAFAVAPGFVVTARHLIAPTNDRLVEAALGTLAPAARPVRAVVSGPVRVTLTRARTDSTDGAADAPRDVAATVLDAGDPVTDLALLRIGAASGPTLALDDSLTAGTSVAGIGFGSAAGPVPTLRLGTLSGQGAVRGAPEDRRLAPIALAVEHGDSGGPVIDDRGHVRGVILRRASGPTPPVMASANALRRLLAAHDVAATESAETTAFRDAMDAFWERRYALASARLSALGERYPDAALVRLESRRADALATGVYTLDGPSRIRGAVLATGAMAMLCLAILMLIRMRRLPALD